MIKYTLIIFSFIFFVSCADAGRNQNVISLSKVYLKTSNTSNSKLKILSSKWKQIEGIHVELKDYNSLNTSFHAPQVKEKIKLVFELSILYRHYRVFNKETSDQVIIYVWPKQDILNRTKRF